MTALAIVIGVAAGVLAGMLGVGGGVLFVPALTLVLGLGQVTGEATSLLAIIPVSLVGAWQQDRNGNVRRRDAVLLGLMSVGGVLVGVVLTDHLPEHILRKAFAILTLLIAAQLVRRALRLDPEAEERREP